MNKSTRYLLVLVGTVSLIALALSVVGSALAQTGTGGTPQAGATVALQGDDTLGTLVDRYTLTGDNLRNFFILNSDLELENGQTINFPTDVTVDLSGQGQGTADQTITDAQLLEFVILNGDLRFASDQSVVLPAGVATVVPENTPAATVAATATSEATATTEATATQENTYVTQEGDTLGDVLGFMGFQANVPVTGTTATATEAAGGATATATEAAGGAVATATATQAAAGTDATATATPAAGDTATATPAATATTGSTSNIPQTGASQAEVDLSGSFTGLNLDLMPGDVEIGRGVYVVRSGDSLSSIARRFNTTVQWLLENNNTVQNANLIFRGQRLVVPQGEVSGVWNYQDLERAFQAAQNKTESQTVDKDDTP